MKVHTSHLLSFRHPSNMDFEEIMPLTAVDLEEFYVEKIVNHAGTVPKKLKYRSRLQGYTPEDDWSSQSRINREGLKRKKHPELNLG